MRRKPPHFGMLFKTLALLLICTHSFAGDAVKPPAPPDETPPPAYTPSDDFLAFKKANPTKIRTPGRVPEDFNTFLPPPGVEVIQYKSGERNLRAWYRAPKGAAASAKVPALVYFHGGFALSKEELDVSQPFVDAGFAVLVPTLRGENGNPGTFELFCGEADDAAAAVRWLAARGEVDATRLYTFGHSAGGAISALLSLYGDLPVRLTGSNGGIYTEELFDILKREKLAYTPFDTKSETEVRLRLLAKNLNSMRRTHVAVIGKQDATLLKMGRQVQLEVEKLKAPLKFATVEGDHEGALPRAIQLYLELLRKDLEQ